MVNVTLFELHLEGAQFTANAPYSAEAEETEEREVEVEDDEEATGGFPFGLLAALGVVAALASLLVAKKVLSGTESEDAPE